jgi:hypothetical protein
MLTRTIYFYGDTVAPDGLPDQMIGYLILASDWSVPDSAIATITAICGGEPRLRPIVRMNGGQKDALEQATNALRAKHSGLKKYFTDS